MLVVSISTLLSWLTVFIGPLKRPHLIIERFDSSYFLIKYFFVHSSWIHLHIGAIAVTSIHHGRSQVARVGRSQVNSMGRSQVARVGRNHVTKANRWIDLWSVKCDHLKAFIVVRQILMSVLVGSPKIHGKNFDV